jgi:DNA-binding FadR family transcriptional regulator
MGSGDLRSAVVDALGREICSGSPPPPGSLTIEGIEARFGVSRPVVREALHALAAVGLIATKRGVGVTALPLSRWNVFDPQVIGWRLAGAQRADQLRTLTELRSAIEPEAARLAAGRASAREAGDLVGLTGRLGAAGREGDFDDFLELDRRFHGTVLALSGNEMFAQLHHLVDAVLVGRTQYGLMPRYPAVEALDLHSQIAGAIQSGDAERAAEAMRAIMSRSLREMTAIWSQALDEKPRSADR